MHDGTHANQTAEHEKSMIQLIELILDQLQFSTQVLLWVRSLCLQKHLSIFTNESKTSFFFI